MRSVKAQLLVTLGAILVATGILGVRGLPPGAEIGYYYFEEDLNGMSRCLNWGGDVDAGDNIYGETLLHYAAQNRSEEVTAFLLARGADVNARTMDGQTPLHLALGSFGVSQKGLVLMLLAAGADLKAVDAAGNTPLHEAIWRCNYWLMASDAARRNGTAETDEVILAAADARQVIEALIEAGADVNARNSDGKTPLLMGFSLGGDYWCAPTETLVRLLHDLGADLNLADNDGNTVVHLWASYPEEPEGGEEKVAMATCIQLGADVNARNREGLTPLHVAAGARFPAGLRALIKAGANIRAQDASGWLPLHCLVFAAESDLSARGQLWDASLPFEEPVLNGLIQSH